LKKGGNEVLVEPCKGWIDPCEYCDKRFNKWLSVDEEIYEKIPDKPGFFMIGLKNKSSMEIVSMLYDEANIQKSAIPVMDKIRDQISNKKSKSTKSEMLVRWIVIKNKSDKENSVLCAHWANNGMLPKYMTTWPGMHLVENNDALMFSKYLQKWCYSKKDPVWRKAKPPPSKTVEEVKKCTLLSSCEVCDLYFTPWKNLSHVIENNMAPNENGLVLLSIVYGKNREVVDIPCNKSTVLVNIKNTVTSFSNNEHGYLKHKKFENRNARSEVRWMVTKDSESDNACFIYAHWLNADTKPLLKHDDMPGERELDKNKHFVLRSQDRKWMYEIEDLNNQRIAKQKTKI